MASGLTERHLQWAAAVRSCLRYERSWYRGSYNQRNGIRGINFAGGARIVVEQRLRCVWYETRFDEIAEAGFVVIEGTAKLGGVSGFSHSGRWRPGQPGSVFLNIDAPDGRSVFFDADSDGLLGPYSVSQSGSIKGCLLTLLCGAPFTGCSFMHESPACPPDKRTQLFHGDVTDFPYSQSFIVPTGVRVYVSTTAELQT